VVFAKVRLAPSQDKPRKPQQGDAVEVRCPDPALPVPCIMCYCNLEVMSGLCSRTSERAGAPNNRNRPECMGGWRGRGMARRGEPRSPISVQIDGTTCWWWSAVGLGLSSRMKIARFGSRAIYVVPFTLSSSPTHSILSCGQALAVTVAEGPEEQIAAANVRMRNEKCVHALMTTHTHTHTHTHTLLLLLLLLLLRFREYTQRVAARR
jgi:hypothetical protein